MNCSTCGATIPDGSKFCRECGAVVTDYTQALKQVAEATGADETQLMAQTPSPEMSYDSLGAGYMTPDSELEASRKKNGELVILVALLIVATLAVAGFVAYKAGLFGGAAIEPEAVEAEAVEAEPAIGRTKVTFNVSAPYYEEPGSSLRLHVAGTTTEGKTVDKVIYISLNPERNEPVELEDGTYIYEATGSPISANGAIYDFGDVRGEFTLNAGADNEVETEIDAELEVMDPLEVTDEQIEAAVESAAGDEACADIAEELKAAATQLRDDYVRAAEEEAARIAAEEEAARLAAEEEAKRAAEEAAIQASSPLNTEWFYIDNVPAGWTLDVTQLSDTEWDVWAEYGLGDLPGNAGNERIKVTTGNGIPDGYAPQGSYEETYVGTSLGSDGLYYHIYVKGIAGGDVIDQSGMYGAVLVIKNPV